MTAATPVSTALALFSLPCADPAWLCDADKPQIRRHAATPAGLAEAQRRLAEIGYAQPYGCVVLARHSATLDDLSGAWGGGAPALIRDEARLGHEHTAK